MNKILKKFGFSHKKLDKVKRTKEVIYCADKNKDVLFTEQCDPADRQKTIDEIFRRNKNIVILNIQPLRGRTKVVLRHKS